MLMKSLFPNYVENLNKDNNYNLKNEFIRDPFSDTKRLIYLSPFIGSYGNGPLPYPGPARAERASWTLRENTTWPDNGVKPDAYRQR